MDLKQELSAALSAFASGNLPKEETVELLLRDVSTRQQLLAHPHLAEELARRASKRSGLACSEVEDLLPAYIDAGRSTHGAPAENKHLERHLHLCPECYEVYRAATDILEAQASAALPTWPQAATVYTASTIVIPRVLIQSRLKSWQRHQAVRGHSKQERHQMLYAGQVPGDPDLFARVIIAQVEGSWQIRVSLRGAGPFLGRQIALRLEDETRTTYADPQGTALFTHIPSTWIMSPDMPDLQILV
jgi:hypothetical protein